MTDYSPLVVSNIRVASCSLLETAGQSDRGFHMFVQISEVVPTLQRRFQGLP